MEVSVGLGDVSEVLVLGGWIHRRAYQLVSWVYLLGDIQSLEVQWGVG